MEFLVPHMVNRSWEGPMDHNYYENFINIDSATSQSDNMDNIKEEIENIDDYIEKNNRDEFIEITEFLCFPNLSNSAPKTKRKNKDDVVTLLKESTDQLEHSVQDRSSNKTEQDQVSLPNDFLYHFFISMYELTKKM